MLDVVVFDVLGDGQAMEQKMWPRHCVQNTWGSQLHQDLKVRFNILKSTQLSTELFHTFIL